MEHATSKRVDTARFDRMPAPLACSRWALGVVCSQMLQMMSRMWEMQAKRCVERQCEGLPAKGA